MDSYSFTYRPNYRSNFWKQKSDIFKEHGRWKIGKRFFSAIVVGFAYNSNPSSESKISCLCDFRNLMKVLTTFSMSLSNDFNMMDF